MNNRKFLSIQELAEKTFGAVCYAGFDSVLWAVEDEHGLARGTLSTFKALNEYKWKILDKALERKHSIAGPYDMAQIITFVTDGKIVYNDEDLDAYQDCIDTVTP